MFLSQVATKQQKCAVNRIIHVSHVNNRCTSHELRCAFNTLKTMAPEEAARRGAFSHQRMTKWRQKSWSQISSHVSASKLGDYPPSHCCIPVLRDWQGYLWWMILWCRRKTVKDSEGWINDKERQHWEKSGLSLPNDPALHFLLVSIVSHLLTAGASLPHMRRDTETWTVLHIILQGHPWKYACQYL